MSSALNEAWAAVEERIDDNWPWSPISWPGVQFDPPKTSPHLWLRPTLLFGDADMESMTTSGWNRIGGLLVLDLFDKPGSGYGVMRARADDLRDLFDRVTVGAVEFKAASGPDIIPNDGVWLHLQVTIPFTVDETS